MVPIFLSVSYSIMKFRFMTHQFKYVNLEPLMHTKAVSFAWQTTTDWTRAWNTRGPQWAVLWMMKNEQDKSPLILPYSQSK